MAQQYGTSFGYAIATYAVYRQLLWDGRHAYERGDRATYWEIAGALQGAGAAMARTKGAPFVVYLGERVVLSTWREQLKIGESLPDPATVAEQSSPIYHRQLGAAFADSATSQGHRESGRQALAIAAKFKSPRINAAIHDRNFDGSDQMEGRLMRRQKVRSWLRCLTAVGFLTWCCLVPWAGWTGSVTGGLRRQSLALVAFSMAGSIALLWLALHNWTWAEEGADMPMHYGEVRRIVTIGGLQTALAIMWLAPLLLASVGPAWLAGARMLWRGEGHQLVSDPRPFLAAFATRLRLVAGALVVSGSAAYLVVLLAALPVRVHGNQMLEQRLQLGEVGAMLVELAGEGALTSLNLLRW